MHRHPDRARGFTLLEVVVTLAVLSISLTVLYQVFSSVARGTRLSADYYRALQIAETQMALLSARIGTQGGRSGTVDDLYHWKTRVQHYRPPADSPLAGDRLVSAAELGQQSYLLTVTVSWGQATDRDLELQTIRLEDEP
ncbi:type II secretion system protein [Seongchinamella unica]|uniref:Type II secretion system protein n=1 Tax=Seongchinamella unica TaxID=2547392 RepID=A0A4R5LUY1_9GAMM|nr:type II secretion system protein [Seongchinamella unica]TDG15234.1 type II secretion system protein [Seongchinamella unica]